MSIFRGMRWLKCDFQVQTPEDGTHWSDDETRLTEPRRPLVPPSPDEHGKVGPSRHDERAIQEAARVFLRRCHALGLELIGVTDHNFSHKTEPRDWFLTHLVEQNKGVAQELSRTPLNILPGFEVDIGYHVLCLFAPATKASHVVRVNKLLCKLGLDENERFKQGKPMPLRRNNATVNLKELIELVQEEHNGIVIAAHADQNDGVLGDPRHIEDYKNQKLLALEVTSNPPAKRVLDIVEGKDRAWARTMCHPAYVMSSDAKSLKVDTNGVPIANSLGYRYTWLKMSQPSIGALRQAFLDPLSRIVLMGPRPSDALRHPRIKSIQVRGAKFIEDQEVVFSEGLNCVIGGRGSGKSSLLEYLRFALGPEANGMPERDTTLERKRHQLRASLNNADATVRVSFEAEGGVSDTLVFTPSKPLDEQRSLEGREVSDIQTVLKQLRVQFFGQGELSRMTGDGGGQQQVLALLDASSGKSLTDLTSREREQQVDVKARFQAARDERRLAGEIRGLEQQAVELERQLNALTAVLGDSTNAQRAVQASQYLEEVVHLAEVTSATVSEAIDAVNMVSPMLPSEAAEWPAADWFASSTHLAVEARSRLAIELTQALERYKATIHSGIGVSASQGPRDAIRLAQEHFVAACTAKGVHPEDIAKHQGLEKERQEVLRQLEAKRLEVAGVQELAAQLPSSLEVLHEIWRQQHLVRVETAKAIQSSVASQTVRVNVSFMRDKSSFLTDWKRLAPRDGRGKLARRWEELGDDVFDSWLSREMEVSPWETVEAGRKDPMAIKYFTGGPVGDDLQPLLIEYISTEDVSQLWEAMRVTRVGDSIDVELLREDQTVAGTMSGSLSEGQRNTLLLNLILSRGDGPLVVDQPEDELDSSFIYKTLVKDLRAVKLRRQLIIATHNANLPVNGDADLVYALEAREGRGKMLAQGGLDQASVVGAVLDIMEGSQQAFRLRREKYHF